MLNHVPELVPKEEAEDGVGAEAQVDGADALVQAQQPLFAGDLQDTIQKPAVELALGREEPALHPRRMGKAARPPCRARDGLTVPSASTGWL